jgi:Bifunctional DNA primase/polymerase, N-terminal/Primase C terminal 1 (PriCT-1)
MTAPSRSHRAALAYARLGVRVIPLGDGGTERAKLPRIPEWQNAGTLQTETIDSWWNIWPEANVGALTGHGRAVVDVDPKAGGLVSLEAMEEAHGAMPLTPTVKTGSGGLHFWFALPDGVVLGNSAGRLGPGLDTRANGGQVVLPPSIHPNGQPYSWLGEARIGEVPFAPMPPWMLAELLGTAGTPKAAPPQEWEGLVSTGAGNGTRNQNLTRIAGHLMRRFVNPQLAYSLIQSWNAQNCHPPLSAREVSTLCDSIAAKELHRREVAS